MSPLTFLHLLWGVALLALLSLLGIDLEDLEPHE